MLSTVFRPRRLTALLLAALMGLSACSAGASRDDTSRASGTSQSPAADAPASADPATDDHAADGGTDGHATGGHQAPLVKAKRLRPGETRRTIEMASSYTPSAPYGTGTDDYRCFLLDPGLEQDAWLTGTHVVPGNPDVVHHVILFQVAPEDVRKARRKDAGDEGEGWTCFGGTGLQEFQNVNHADWIGAWAPGGDESVIKPGFGVRLAKGSRIVMQVHYNLLAGAAEDVSAAQLRLAPGERDYQSLSTMLLPAPVELPCRAEHAEGSMCSRPAALADVRERFGEEGRTADLLHFLCGTTPTPGEYQSCTRTLPEPITIHGVAAHMHLLGREFEIVVRPGTPRARTILRIPVWNFDDQGGIPIKPVSLAAGEEVEVTCRHVQELRDHLPAFEGQPDRYVVWGEGTTDEMCLGMLQVTRP